MKTSIDKIDCPRCGTQIPVTEALQRQLTDSIKAEVSKEVEEKERILATKEKELESKEKDLKIQAQSIDQKVSEQLSEERTRIEIEAKEKADKATALELQDARAQIAEQEQRLKESQDSELEIRKQKREIEEREKALELETVRRIDEEKIRIEEETTKRLQESHRLKDAEKDKKLQDALRMNEELQRKLQQGSQQTQGEVMELELEKIIGSTFPIDQIEPVPKGISGADVIQRVFNRSGHSCGIIVWEIKRTKAWSDGWIQKFKDDQRMAKAELAILVSETLPKEVENFANLNGIWVTNQACAMSLASALRTQLIEIETTKLSAVGKNEKMEVLYRYISGSEFKQRVEAIVEAFVNMQTDLQEERRTMEKRWAKRDKQIQRVISNTSGMYGDFQSYLGSALQTIPALSSGESKDNDRNIEKIREIEILPENNDMEDIPF